MTRSVADVVAELRTHAQHEESLCRLTNELKAEAAALLERLDAENTYLREVLRSVKPT